MAENANVWKVVLQDAEETVIGTIGLYVDDILITSQDEYAGLVASTLSQQWKTTKPQWLDQEGLAFHGFEIKQEDTAIILLIRKLVWQKCFVGTSMLRVPVKCQR